MTEKFLDKVYDIGGRDATRDLYNDWAASYDAEVSENGYATPARCAAALAEFVEDGSTPILDIGCGTGLSGLAYRAGGFTVLDGLDLSPEMIAQARARGIYRTLREVDLEDPLPVPEGSYTAVSAVGVLNPGHAPAETLDAVMGILPAGGHFVFSLNDHALADWTYEGRISGWVDEGGADLVFKAYGEHLPKIDLKSTVYVLRKR
ncbi:MAG: methyltransferase domain-containing protein [Pseudomonadota bacterium]